MLDRLRTSNRLVEAARSAVNSPCEVLSEALNTVTRVARQAVGGAFDSAQEIFHGVDRDSVENWLSEISRLPKCERQSMLFESFSEAINKDFNLFYSLLEALSGVDLIRCAERKKVGFGGRGLLSDEELFAPLEVDYDIFSAAIKAAQSSPKFTEWKEFIVSKNANNSAAAGEDVIDFTGASIPTLFPKVQKYQKDVVGYSERRPLDRGKIFGQLTDVFKKVAEEVFGNEMEAFYTKGTSDAFLRLVNRMDKKFPATEYIFSPYEYLPMVYVTDDQKRHVVDVDGGANFNEEGLVAAMLKKGEGVMSSREEQVCTAPIVLVVSTQPRIGGRLLDFKKIASLVEAENARLGRHVYHLWFDASQDSRIVNEGDTVFASKRFASSGGGMVLMNNETYPADQNDMKEAVHVRSGYDLKTIPQIIASLACQRDKYGHEFGQLLKSSALWNYQGKGRYLHGEVSAARCVVEDHPLLKRFFTLEGDMLPLDGEHWNIDAILRLVPTEEARRKIDLRQLERELKRRNVNISTFALGKLNSADVSVPTFDKLQGAFDEQPFSLAKFIAMAKEFEDYYKDQLVCTLLPQSNLTEENVRAHFERVVKEHNYFRIFTTAIQPQGTLDELLYRLDQALSSMPGLAT